MAKRFKLKLSRVIPSFQLCRSKKPSNMPETPVPAIHRLSPMNPKALEIGYPNFPAPPPSTPDYSFIKRHLSPKIASVGCGCRARSCTQYLSPEVSYESPGYSRKKEASRVHIVSKAHQNSKPQRRNYGASFSDAPNEDISSVLASKYERKKKKEKKMEKVKPIASVSSRDSRCFSSEEAENEETETLISTILSFSDDSSIDGMDQSLESLTEGPHMETEKNKKNVNNSRKMKRLRSFGSKKYRGSKSNVSKTKMSGAASSENHEAPAKGSMLGRMMPHTAAEGKVRESVAVVKKSEDPYEDFKRSMLEMILEKQMFEAKELEQLLQCFLSLNSREYHVIIVEAFTEIWEALFCDCPMNVL